MSEIQLNTIPEAVEAIRRGEMIIVVDDEDRENEGDFIAAAEKVTPEMVNFMTMKNVKMVKNYVLTILFGRLRPFV